MDINELAQWIVICFMGVFVVGLTRQLGTFLLPHAEQLAEAGPTLGQKLTDSLLPASHLRTTRELAESSVAGLAGIIVIDERCPGCREMVEVLEAGYTRIGIPLVALLKESSDPSFRKRVSDTFALVSDDPSGERSARAQIAGTPFAMVVDASLRVQRKLFGPDSVERLSREFPEAATEPPMVIVHPMLSGKGSAAAMGGSRS